MSAPTDNANNQVAYHRIRCGQEERYAFFHPVRQLLVLADTDAKTETDLGFSPSRLLDLLISRANTIVTRDEIMAYAWPDRIVTPNSLNQAISSLRELLGDEKDKRIIQTVPRRGYLFNSEYLPSAEEVPTTIESVVNTDMAAAPLALSNLKKPRWMSLLPQWRAMPTPLLAVTLLIMLATLAYRIDWELLLQPGLVIDTQQLGSPTLIYTAPDSAKLHILQDATAALRERLLKLAKQSDTLIFNRVQDYYEVNCIEQNGVVEFIYIHSSQLQHITDQQLLECLR